MHRLSKTATVEGCPLCDWLERYALPRLPKVAQLTVLIAMENSTMLMEYRTRTA